MNKLELYNFTLYGLNANPDDPVRLELWKNAARNLATNILVRLNLTCWQTSHDLCAKFPVDVVYFLFTEMMPEVWQRAKNESEQAVALLLRKDIHEDLGKDCSIFQPATCYAMSRTLHAEMTSLLMSPDVLSDDIEERKALYTSIKEVCTRYPAAVLSHALTHGRYILHEDVKTRLQSKEDISDATRAAWYAEASKMLLGIKKYWATYLEPRKLNPFRAEFKRIIRTRMLSRVWGKVKRREPKAAMHHLFIQSSKQLAARLKRELMMACSPVYGRRIIALQKEPSTPEMMENLVRIYGQQLSTVQYIDRSEASTQIERMKLRAEDDLPRDLERTMLRIIARYPESLVRGIILDEENRDALVSQVVPVKAQKVLRTVIVGLTECYAKFDLNRSDYMKVRREGRAAFRKAIGDLMVNVQTLVKRTK